MIKKNFVEGYRGSKLASHPAAVCSILGLPKYFSLAEIY